MVSISSANASADSLVMFVRSTAEVNSVELFLMALANPSKPSASFVVSPLMMVALNLRMMELLDSSRCSWYKSLAASFATRSMDHVLDRMPTLVVTRLVLVSDTAGSELIARNSAVIGVSTRL